MTSDLDLRERRQLCDRFLALGPDAPTLSGEWRTRDLAAHLAVRERNILAGPGILFGGPFARVTDSAMARELERHGYEGTVERVRTGPPPGPLRIAAVRYRTNLAEFTVHHEDVRRANGDGPRVDRPDLQDAVWDLLEGVFGRLIWLSGRVRHARLVIRRPDGQELAFGAGAAVAQLEAEPVEALLYLYGRRSAAEVALSGDSDARRAVEQASFGV